MDDSIKDLLWIGEPHECELDETEIYESSDMLDDKLQKGLIMGILASLGIGLITDMVKSHGEDLVTKGIEKVTGIELNKPLSEEDKLKIKASIAKIQKEIELSYQDGGDARDMAIEVAVKGKDWLVRNTGSMIAMMIVLGVFILFILLLVGTLSIENSSVAMIVGFAGGYVTQVLSFYFGSSKTEADRG